MIEEPYRWVEAIANRREYIETELSTGSPTIGLSYPEGQLLLTFGRDRRKIFEVYDRIAMGGIGHPGDLERLRMLAIELASTEGFSRSAADVSLRRMATYTFSPALKQAFEQIYGAPYLARILFAEVGRTPAEDLFLRLDYDGSMNANAMVTGKSRESFGVIAGTKRSLEAAETYLRTVRPKTLLEAVKTAVHAWTVARYATDEDHSEPPDAAALSGFLREQLNTYTIEAALLERAGPSRIAFTEVPEKIFQEALTPILAIARNSE
jgi:proteasome alpha subunit